jgi:hypothetical protein
VLNLKGVEGAPGVAPELSRWVADEQGVVLIHVGSTKIAYPGDNGVLPDPEGLINGPSRIHHIAFDCKEFDEVLDRIVKSGTPYDTNFIPQIGLKQLYVMDPNHVYVELNFWAD